MKGTRYALAALLGAVLMVTGCKEESTVSKYHPAKVEETEQKGIMRVTLDARAAERIGLQTAAVTEDRVGAASRNVMPYGALLYDTKGETWAFTNPQPLVFIRQKVVVQDIVGDRVILAEGLPAGTVVVTVGATELLGAEHKYGH